MVNSGISLHEEGDYSWFLSEKVYILPEIYSAFLNLIKRDFHFVYYNLSNPYKSRDLKPGTLNMEAYEDENKTVSISCR